VAGARAQLRSAALPCASPAARTPAEPAPRGGRARAPNGLLGDGPAGCGVAGGDHAVTLAPESGAGRSLSGDLGIDGRRPGSPESPTAGSEEGAAPTDPPRRPHSCARAALSPVPETQAMTRAGRARPRSQPRVCSPLCTRRDAHCRCSPPLLRALVALSRPLGCALPTPAHCALLPMLAAGAALYGRAFKGSIGKTSPAKSQRTFRREHKQCF